jgi:signal transduction histidine kinase
MTGRYYRSKLALVSIIFSGLGIWVLVGNGSHYHNSIPLLCASVGLGISAFILISSERKLNKLAQQNQELEKAHRNRDLLFSMAIHDLQGPAHNLSMLMSLLNRKELAEKDQLQLMEHMRSSVGKHFELVKKLLEWTTTNICPETGNSRHCDLHTTVKEVCEQYRSKSEQKEITVLNYVTAPFPVMIPGPVLEAVIGNILHNAIKFTPGGGAITISAKKMAGAIEISITDTGIGMPNEQVNRLFEGKIRHRSVGTMNEQGSGIGLILCHELVKKAGGSINAVSQLGKGSTFSFRMPEKLAVVQSAPRAANGWQVFTGLKAFGW